MADCGNGSALNTIGTALVYKTRYKRNNKKGLFIYDSEYRSISLMNFKNLYQDIIGPDAEGLKLS